MFSEIFAIRVDIVYWADPTSLLFDLDKVYLKRREKALVVRLRVRVFVGEGFDNVLDGGDRGILAPDSEDHVVDIVCVQGCELGEGKEKVRGVRFRSCDAEGDIDGAPDSLLKEGLVFFLR